MLTKGCQLYECKSLGWKLWWQISRVLDMRTGTKCSGVHILSENFSLYVYVLLSVLYLSKRCLGAPSQRNCSIFVAYCIYLVYVFFSSTPCRYIAYTFSIGSLLFYYQDWAEQQQHLQNLLSNHFDKCFQNTLNWLFWLILWEILHPYSPCEHA
jgi:hypothetical protein